MSVSHRHPWGGGGGKTLLVTLLAAVAAVGASAAVVITDDIPSPQAVSVAAGEELQIRGNGLTEACTLTLGEGARVVFHSTATLAAAVTVSGSASFETGDSSVTGTVSGAVTGAATSGDGKIDLLARGPLRFSGGGTIGAGHSVWMRGGCVEIVGKPFSARCSLYFEAGRLVVRDGGAWRDTTTSWKHIRLDQKQTGDACLEIGPGGEVCVGNNNELRVGGDSSYESRFLVNGGTFARETADAIRLNADGAGNGVVELAAGTFRSARPITCGNTTGAAKIVLGDGLWQSYGVSKYGCLVDGNGTCEIAVAGSFTLDLSGYAAARVASCDAATTSRVTCGDNGRLRVLGSGKTFVLCDLADDGLVLDQTGTGACAIELADAPETVRIGWCLPSAADLSASGTSPDLSVDCILTAGGALTAPLDFAGFTGFHSIASGADLVVATLPETVTYITKTALASFPGRLRLVSGTLLLDEDPGAARLVREGGSVRFQDADALVLSNRSKVVTADAGWTNAAGEETGWTPGAVGAITTFESNGHFDGVLAAHGLRVGGAGDHYWDGGDGRFEIGSGGLTFTQSKKWGLARGIHLTRILLASDQVWTNAAASGTAYLQFGFSYEVPKYYKAAVAAAAGVSDWRLGGSLETWLYSPSNDLRNVSVTVSEPARLRLVGALDARLNAKELVLDGADMAFGQKLPCNDTYGHPGESVAAIDASHLAPTVTLRHGGTLTAAKEGASFAVPHLKAIGAGNAVVGASLVLTQDVTSVSVAAAEDSLSFESEIRTPTAAAFSVSGLGTLAFCVPGEGLSADVAFLNGGRLRLTGAGTWAGNITGAGGVTIAANGAIGLAGSLGVQPGDTVEILSGTLVLPAADAIPSGVRIVTKDEGALMLVDPTGFDAQTQMGGTRNLAASRDLVVTDAARENEALSVRAGETLQIFGDGLKASSTVTLEDGARLVFCRTATLGASVKANGAATLAAARGVVGTLGGAFEANAAAASYTDISGAGSVVFAGGATFANAFSRLRICGGSAQVTAGKLTVTKAPVTMLAGSLQFFDSEFVCVGDGVTLDLANADQSGDACVAFRTGSKWTLGNNQSPTIGFSEVYESRLVLDGGVWSCTTSDAFTLCPKGRGRGVFEFKSGKFSSNRRITAGAGGTSRFIWSGGTFAGQWNSTNFKYDHLINGPLSEFLLSGDCTLSLDRMLKPVVSNFNNSAAMMRALPGASLTIVSEATQEGGCTNVVFTNFQGDGLKLVQQATEKNGFPLVTFADAQGPVALTRTWCAPEAGEVGLVQATGSTRDLLVNYVVPSGSVYAASERDAAGFVGFASVSVSNLVFEAGSGYRFSIVDSVVTPLALLGTLTLPSEMRYFADAAVRPGKIKAASLIVPAGGIVGADCVWRCGGGLSRRASRVYAEDGVLKLDNEPTGLLYFIR